MCFNVNRFNYAEEDTFFPMLSKSKRTINAETTFDFWYTDKLKVKDLSDSTKQESKVIIMSNTELQKENDIHNEQQPKSKQEIIDNIIEILLSNKGMSVYYGKEILCEAIYTLYKIPIICK